MGSKLSFQLQSLQFQRVADNLIRANKYLKPNYEKTWTALLDKANSFSPEFDYNQDPIPEEFPGPDTVSPTTPAVQKVVDTDETDLQPDSDANKPTQTDIYGEPAQEVTEKPPPKQLRFGRSYTANLQTTLPNPQKGVLKVQREFYEVGATPPSHQVSAYKRACQAAESHGLKLRTVLSETSKPPGHKPQTPKCTRKQIVKWNEAVSVREFPGIENIDKDSTCDLKETTPTITSNTRCYIMTCLIGLDASMREIMYLAHSSQPSPINETFPDKKEILHSYVLRFRRPVYFKS